MDRKIFYGCQRPAFNQVGLWNLTPAGLSVAGQRFGIAGEALSGPEDVAAFCRYLVVPARSTTRPSTTTGARLSGRGRMGRVTSTTPPGEEFRRHRSPRSRAR